MALHDTQRDLGPAHYTQGALSVKTQVSVTLELGRSTWAASRPSSRRGVLSPEIVFWLRMLLRPSNSFSYRRRCFALSLWKVPLCARLTDGLEALHAARVGHLPEVLRGTVRNPFVVMRCRRSPWHRPCRGASLGLHVPSRRCVVAAGLFFPPRWRVAGQSPDPSQRPLRSCPLCPEQTGASSIHACSFPARRSTPRPLPPKTIHPGADWRTTGNIVSRETIMARATDSCDVEHLLRFNPFLRLISKRVNFIGN